MTERSFEEEMKALAERDWSGGEDEVDGSLWIFGSCCLALIAPPVGLIVGLFMLFRRDVTFAALAFVNSMAGAALWYLWT